MKFISRPDFYLHGEDLEPDEVFVMAMLNPAMAPEQKVFSDYWISDDNDIIIFKARVNFGYRIWAGYMDSIDSCHELDICCGPNKLPFDLMLFSIKKIIETNVNSGREAFHGIPGSSREKPWFNDQAFVQKIESLLALAVP